VAGLDFQACSIDQSDISPFKINDLRAVWIDYRKTLLQILLFWDAICIQRFADVPKHDQRGNCVRPFNVVGSLTAICQSPTPRNERADDSRQYAKVREHSQGDCC